MTKVKITSIATALPTSELAQVDALQMARQFNCQNTDDERILRSLYRRTTIEKRRTVLSLSRTDATYTATAEPTTAERMAIYKAKAAPLAIEATAAALAQAKLAPDAIGNLVTVSCTGFFSPGIDTQIIKSVALPRGVSRTNVGFMGCHGALNGLRVATSLAQTSGKPSLLVAAELCSLHFQYGFKSDDILANALFADGAAATVLSPVSEEAAGMAVIASGSHLIEDTEAAMTWEIGDKGFKMTLSPKVPSLIERHLKDWLTTFLNSHGTAIEEVAAWAIHPGGPKILDAVERALNLDASCLIPSRQVLRRLGNMSSPTILFILKELLEGRYGAPGNGPVVALAFGPGLTIEAAILRNLSAI
ncbi:MAG: type III polyketide synthase [Cyanobacteria bacterium SZAS LIN-3]|nr:type III polyketide synthase [Cyanobacteria bacterium SZAS LIN-3]